MLNTGRYSRFAVPLLTIGLGLVALFMPWRTHPANLSILVSGFFWLFFINEHSRQLPIQTKWYVLFFVSLYAIEVIGIIHTDNMKYGLFRLETKLPLLGFPAIILASALKQRSISMIFIVFISSTLLACFWCLSVAFGEIQEDGNSISSFFEAGFVHTRFTAPLQQLHPTYLSLFICLSVGFIAEYIYYRGKAYYYLFVVIGCLLAFVIPLASRAGAVAAVVTMVFVGSLFIGKKRKVILLIYVGVIVSSAALITYFTPALKMRLITSFAEADLSHEQENSVSYHFKSWHCAFKKWIEGGVIFGYGTGDEVITITDCYTELGWVDHRHDAHNEYLSSLVKHGIVGFTILMAVLVYPLVLAIRNEDWLYTLFLTTVMICLLSESMLRAQTGLVYYAFFNALLFKRMLLRTTESNMVKIR